MFATPPWLSRDPLGRRHGFIIIARRRQRAAGAAPSKYGPGFAPMAIFVWSGWPGASANDPKGHHPPRRPHGLRVAKYRQKLDVEW